MTQKKTGTREEGAHIHGHNVGINIDYASAQVPERKNMQLAVHARKMRHVCSVGVGYDRHVA
jgi:hypothetical protein